MAFYSEVRDFMGERKENLCVTLIKAEVRDDFDKPLELSEARPIAKIRLITRRRRTGRTE